MNGYLRELQGDLDVPDIKSVSGGLSFMETVWMFGCAPDHKSLSFLPNHAASIRVFAAGGSRYILLEYSSWHAAQNESLSAEQEVHADQLLSKHRGLEDKIVEILKKPGVKAQQCTLKQYEALFVPTGWMIAEVAQNCPLLYGFRKTSCRAASLTSSRRLWASRVLAARVAARALSHAWSHCLRF